MLSKNFQFSIHKVSGVDEIEEKCWRHKTLFLRVRSGPFEVDELCLMIAENRTVFLRFGWSRQPDPAPFRYFNLKAMSVWCLELCLKVDPVVTCNHIKRLVNLRHRKRSIWPLLRNKLSIETDHGRLWANISAIPFSMVLLFAWIYFRVKHTNVVHLL
jgi:hypothetical protein